MCDSSPCVCELCECASTVNICNKRQTSHIQFCAAHSSVLFIIFVSDGQAVRAGRSSSPSVHQMLRLCSCAFISILRFWSQMFPHLSAGRLSRWSPGGAVGSGISFSSSGYYFLIWGQRFFLSARADDQAPSAGYSRQRRPGLICRGGEMHRLLLKWLFLRRKIMDWLKGVVWTKMLQFNCNLTQNSRRGCVWVALDLRVGL